MPFFSRRTVARPAVAPAPVARPAVAPAPVAAPAAQPNLSGAIGQLKAGNQFGAQNTMRQAVGLPTIAPPPANANPTMSDAIGRMKMGDRASAEAMLRKMVGLKKGGQVSASKRADGIVQRGKTRGRMV